MEGELRDLVFTYGFIFTNNLTAAAVIRGGDLLYQVFMNCNGDCNGNVEGQKEERETESVVSSEFRDGLNLNCVQLLANGVNL